MGSGERLTFTGEGNLIAVEVENRMAKIDDRGGLIQINISASGLVLESLEIAGTFGGFVKISHGR